MPEKLSNTEITMGIQTLIVDTSHMTRPNTKTGP